MINSQVWYLSSVVGIARRPTFSELEELYDLPRGTEHILFLPVPPRTTRGRNRPIERTTISGGILRRDGYELVEGEIQYVLGRFGRENSELPKVVIVNGGYGRTLSYMKDRYGWIEELRRLSQPVAV